MPGQYYGSNEIINLEKNFPQIEDIHGVVEIYPSFGGPDRKVRIYTRQNLPGGFIFCNSSVCNNGGVPLGDIFQYKLSEMIRDKQVEGTASKMCQGFEKMGGGQTRKCRTTYVKVTIQLKYKDIETEEKE